MYLFIHPPTYREMPMATTIRARIYVWGGEFCQVSIFAKLICQTVGGHFSYFAKIRGILSWFGQTIGVATVRI
jgi:hypothetical protein